MAGSMNRRTLIRYGALGGVAAVAAGPLAARDAAVPSAAPPPFELEEATVASLQKRLGAGSDTARSLAEKYLARIEALDRKGPRLRAVLELNPGRPRDRRRPRRRAQGAARCAGRCTASRS